MLVLAGVLLPQDQEVVLIVDPCTGDAWVSEEERGTNPAGWAEVIKLRNQSLSMRHAAVPP
jgi:hypothetical protein